MSYLALARKWRPHDFASLVGQDHVRLALENAITLNRLHHAFLFTGTRGVGKTTIARILAKCLNCETAITATPCQQCATCQAIDQGRFIDLIEVDAASKTKVEDTRELLENVPYAPSRGRFKIYLIDEVHMLSNHSFNALLKTLEEPPPHVKFLFATTEPQKLPITILSRCLQFHLKSITAEKITAHLQNILSSENIPYDTAALNLIAKAANGSIRDSLSLLDQAIAYCNSDIQLQPLQNMLGCVNQTVLVDLLQNVVANDCQAMLKIINDMADLNIHFDTALSDVLHLLHQLAIAKQLGTLEDNALNELFQQLSPESIQLYYQIALHGRQDLPFAPNQKLGFEMTLLRMLSFQVAAPVAASSVTHTTPEKKTLKQSVQLDSEKWLNLIQQLSLSGPLKALAQHTHFIKHQQNTLYLSVSEEFSPLLNENKIKQFTQALQPHFPEALQLQISVQTDHAATTATPAMLLKKQQQDKKQAATEQLNQDPHLQQILNEFDGKLIPNSIKLVDEPVK